MVLNEAGHDSDVCVWGEYCDHEDFHGAPPGNKVQTEYDGTTGIRTIIYLLGQHVSHS